MDENGLQRDSAAWLFFVKASWVASVAAAGVGIFFLPADLWVKGYMAMALLFVIGTSITLSKTIRDAHEAQRLINRIADAKTEKILHEYSEN